MPKQGQIVDTSHSNGLSVWQAWCKLLEDNEKYWSKGKYSQIKTDPELIEQMRKCFPQRKTEWNPRRVRGVYNRKRKEVVTHRYMRDGEKRVCRATAHGLPVSNWKR